MPGPLPKPQELRQKRRHYAGAARLPAEVNPIKRAPKLPTVESIVWHSMTKKWWSDVWASPMSGEYLRSDVNGLLVLAVLVNKFFTEPKASLAAEIRLQSVQYGLDPLSRRRLEWQTVKTDEAKEKRDGQRSANAMVIIDPRDSLK